MSNFGLVRGKGKVKFSFFSPLLVLLFLLIVLPTISAAQPPQVVEYVFFENGYTIQVPTANFGLIGLDQEVRIHVFNTSNGLQLPAGTHPEITCRLELYDRNGLELYDSGAMQNDSLDWHTIISAGNFTYAGEYARVIWCVSSTAGGFNEDTINLLHSGNLNVFLILALSSVVILILGFIFKNWILGFLSGILFILTGMNAMIYGISGMADLYTRGIAITAIGIGIILSVAAGYEAAVGGKDED